jgi:hypothetical protein
MNRQNKIILGVASLWPLLWLYLLFAFAFLTFFVILLLGGDYAAVSPWVFVLIAPFHILTIVDILILLLIYGLDLVKRDAETLDIEKKVLWGAALLLAPPFAMPAYWYFYVWLGKPES